MPTTLQNIPITEELRQSHPKLVANLEVLAEAIDLLAEAIDTVSARIARSSSAVTISSAGTTNVAAGSPDHFALITMNAASGTAVVSLPITARLANDRMFILMNLTETGGATVEIRDAGGDLLNSFTNDGLILRVTANLIFDGAKWQLITFV